MLSDRLIVASFVLVTLMIELGSPLDARGQEKEEIKLQEIKLWPDGLPAGSVVMDPEKVKKLKAKEVERSDGRKYYVDSPALTVFQAPEVDSNGCAVVICPGGAYNVLAWQKEGVELAQWFNSIGVTAFVLEYRVPRRIPDKIHWEPMQDVQRAIRLVRQYDTKYGIDSNRVGVLGFSAGGHLAVMAGVQYETKCYEPVDHVDKRSARPNFICPIYAAYLADGYKDDKAELGELITVTKDTPPTFMAAAWDDKFRGAQSALLFSRLREHNVPAELHAYSKGGHGYGIRKSENPVSNWHHHLEAWLKVSTFLTPGSPGSEQEPEQEQEPGQQPEQ